MMPADDNALMERVKQGETLAFECLLKRHRRGVLRFLTLFVGDEELAADLTQETFIRVFFKAHRYKAEGAFSTWVYRIARNLAISHFRRIKVRRMIGADAKAGELAVDLDRIPSTASSWMPEKAAMNKQLMKQIDTILEGMSPKLREAFLLCDVMGLNLKEISNVTGAGLPTVKVRVFRARRQLRDELGPFMGSYMKGREEEPSDAHSESSPP